MNPFTIEDSSMSLDKLGLDCVFLEEKDIPNRTREFGRCRHFDSKQLFIDCQKVAGVSGS